MSALTARLAKSHFGRLLQLRSVSSSVLSGANPVDYDSTNPITLFLVQLFIIIIFTQGLGFLFRYIKQPKVIAEVIGGIILGPTAMGHIPHFSTRIFPTQSLPYLNLVASIGLILFLFLVGLEVDLGVAKRNGRQSALISLAGMCLPFGLGAAVAVPVYHNFVDTAKSSFGHFLLFVGVAMSITAFPVLCRILTATKLLDTKVGVMVLSAGVGNDVVGWVLLALTLALVNSGTGVTAVYVLLCAVGWAIVLLWPIRKAYAWLVRRTGSIENGPTPAMMIITLLIVFISAFVTDIIGVHPIFGGFIAGLIIPHENGYAIHVTERLDDLVSLLLLPIYFVLSGLQTNLSLLDTGKIWGYVILLCVVAFVGKFVGCAGTAKLLRYSNRESAAIGMLMSCKGLVELIVLNVGLSAGIINQQLFSMFVVEAVVLTFVTTPATLWIYPEHVRTRGSADQPTVKASDEGKTASFSVVGRAAGGREFTHHLLVVLQKVEHLAAVMYLTHMLEPIAPQAPPPWNAANVALDAKHSQGESLGSSTSSPNQEVSALPQTDQSSPFLSGSVTIDALKIIELTGRTFSVMQSAEKDQLLLTDDALQLYRQFGRLKGIDVRPHITIVGDEHFPAAVEDHARDLSSELVVIPWTISSSGGMATLIDPTSPEREGMVPSSSTTTALEAVFGFDATAGSPMYTHFIRNVFTRSSVDVALIVDRGFGSSASFPLGSGQHIFLPFFGGADDRLALRLVVQLCCNPYVTATVVRLEHDAVDESTDEDGSTAEHELTLSDSIKVHQNALQTNQLTVGVKASEQTRVASETADNLAWSYYATQGQTERPPRASLDTSLARMSFWSTTSNRPLTDTLTYAENAITQQGGAQWRPLLVVTGRGRHGASINHSAELSKMLATRGLNPSVGAELRKTVGDPAAALMLNGGAPATASFLVLEAGQKR
ncbi:K(+)/H(+) antiporter [Cryptotrichosporon argae]